MVAAGGGLSILRYFTSREGSETIHSFSLSSCKNDADEEKKVAVAAALWRQRETVLSFYHYLNKWESMRENGDFLLLKSNLPHLDSEGVVNALFQAARQVVGDQIDVQIRLGTLCQQCLTSSSLICIAYCSPSLGGHCPLASLFLTTRRVVAAACGITMAQLRDAKTRFEHLHQLQRIEALHPEKHLVEEISVQSIDLSYNIFLDHLNSDPLIDQEDKGATCGVDIMYMWMKKNFHLSILRIVEAAWWAEICEWLMARSPFLCSIDLSHCVGE